MVRKKDVGWQEGERKIGQNKNELDVGLKWKMMGILVIGDGRKIERKTKLTKGY